MTFTIDNIDLTLSYAQSSIITNNAIEGLPELIVNLLENKQIAIKTIFLLELSGGNTADKCIQSTMQYFWNLYPLIYQTIQIIDTQIDINTGLVLTNTSDIIQNNISYMTRYYDNLYTLFIGFSRSTVLTGVLDWFKLTNHHNAMGISLNSSSDTLNFPKPIYRLQPPDNNLITSLNTVFENSGKIYYIYSDNEIASLSLLDQLNYLYPNKIVSFGVNANSNNLTLENIKIFFTNINTNCSILSYLFVNNNDNTFVNLFTDSYPLPTNCYNMSLFGIPTINDSTKNAIANKYYYLDYFSFSTSYLFRQGALNLGSSFSSAVPNCLLLINLLITQGRQSITSIPSHNSILEFNENNDLLYNTVSFSLYTKQNNIYEFEITLLKSLSPYGYITINI